MNYQIEMTGITKAFPGVTANDNVTLNLKKGEIHTLLGENGAGKSTLMKILFGLYKCDKGEIRKNGKKVNIANPNDAGKLGIGMVHQHFNLVHNFSVLENIILGAETVKRGFLQTRDARRQVTELSRRYKLDINPDSIISDITVGMQQKTEILKMLYRENEILIFDEPTTMLTPQETEDLLRIMKNLKEEGKSILFITHKLDEIKTAADRCTVLRKGKNAGTVNVENAGKEELSEMMMSRKIDFYAEKKEKLPGKTILKAENLTVINKTAFNNNPRKAAVSDVSFEVRSGEIVCIAGIDGNGQNELVSALSGLIKADSGNIFLNGENVTLKKSFSKAIAHIPQDSRRYAVVQDFNLAFNFALHNYYAPRFQKNGFLKFDEMYNYAQTIIDAFDIRSAQGSRTIAREVSGGNLQKAVTAREISRETDILIAVHPTKGLDAGAREFIHRQLIEQRDKGRGVLLVSLDLGEVMNISDRIFVIHNGKIAADVKPNDVTLQQLGLFMSGSSGQNVI